MYSGRTVTSKLEPTGISRSIPFAQRIFDSRDGTSTQRPLPFSSFTGLPFENVRHTDEICDETVHRLIVSRVRIAFLLYSLVFHDNDPIAHNHCLGLIVGDVNRRQFELFYEVRQLDPHSLTQFRIEVAQRLIEKKDTGVISQSAGEGDPLLLASGEFGGVSCAQTAQAHEFKRLDDFFVDFGAARALGLNAVSHVLGYRHVRPYGVRLKHHAETAFLWRQTNPVAAPK